MTLQFQILVLVPLRSEPLKVRHGKDPKPPCLSPKILGIWKLRAAAKFGSCWHADWTCLYACCALIPTGPPWPQIKRSIPWHAGCGSYTWIELALRYHPTCSSQILGGHRQYVLHLDWVHKDFGLTSCFLNPLALMSLISHWAQCQWGRQFGPWKRTQGNLRKSIFRVPAIFFGRFGFCWILHVFFERFATSAIWPKNIVNLGPQVFLGWLPFTNIRKMMIDVMRWKMW